VAYSLEQKKWFHHRDQDRCQFPIWDSKRRQWRICGSTVELQVHHIIPQRFSIATRGCTLDIATNGILICLECHKKIHKDLAQAFNAYHADQHSFSKMIHRRDERMKRGEIYWDSQYDLMLLRIAEKNTFTFKRRGGYKFPRTKVHHRK